MKPALLFASAGIAAGLLFVNVYNSMVDAASWAADGTQSIATARSYFKTVNPGTFFRAFSPLNQLLALAVLLLFWKSAPATRPWLATALLLYVATDAFTFAYFYPRNAVLFETGPLADWALLEKTVREWARMNWLRSAIVLAGVCCTFRAVSLLQAVPAAGALAR